MSYKQGKETQSSYFSFIPLLYPTVLPQALIVQTLPFWKSKHIASQHIVDSEKQGVKQSVGNLRIGNLKGDRQNIVTRNANHLKVLGLFAPVGSAY